MKNVCLILLASLFCASLWAKPETHEIEKGKKVTIDVPTNWESVVDLFGMPLAILGPWENESRPALMVVFTNLSLKKFDQSEFEALFKGFKNEKENWVKTHQGQLISFEEVSKVDLSPEVKGIYIGSEFIINEIHYVERSYYLYCKSEVYNVKWSTRDEHRVQISVLNKMVEDFKCE